MAVTNLVTHHACICFALWPQRGKLDMEDIFRQAIPVSERYGTQFVFRSGDSRRAVLHICALPVCSWVMQRTATMQCPPPKKARAELPGCTGAASGANEELEGTRFSNS